MDVYVQRRDVGFDRGLKEREMETKRDIIISFVLSRRYRKIWNMPEV